jgi:hypothetical protein
LRVGDPRREETDVGPLARPQDRYDEPLTVPGLAGTFAAPTVIAGLAADDPRFATPPPGPLLAVVEVPDADTAVALAARDGRDGPISVWARDADKGERVARRLPAPTTWVGRHGVAPTGVAVRLARHVAPRQLEWRAAWAPGTPSLPADETAVAAQTALVEVLHGRESRRWPALRTGARVLLRSNRRDGE